VSTVAEKLQRKSQRSVGAKQVRLKLVYIDFWSAVKLSFLIAVCGAIVLVVAAFFIWVVVSSLGVLDRLDGLFGEILGEEAPAISELFSLGQVMLFAIILGVINLVSFTAIGAITALLYNLSVKVTGGQLVGFTNN
jgi:hypothetical protein